MGICPSHWQFDDKPCFLARIGFFSVKRTCKKSWCDYYYPISQLLLLRLGEIVILRFVGHFFVTFMSRSAVTITLDPCEQALLEKITRQLTVPEYKKQRVRAVLAAATGQQNKDIAKQIELNRNEVGKWRKRWATQHPLWQQSDVKLRPEMDAKLVLHWLADQKGRGRKNEITLEQRAKVRFIYAPKHCSWLNQIEIWFSGLSRRVLSRGNVDSVASLQKKILNDIAFYNQTAKPMKWKYERQKNISNSI